MSGHWLNCQQSAAVAMTAEFDDKKTGSLESQVARLGISGKSPGLDYLAIAALDASIFAFTASRLKLAPFCIGGNSTAVVASFSTSCWTNTKRQNSYLNQSKYCCAPTLVPLSGQPVRSNGSRRRLTRYGMSTWTFAPSQPSG